MSSSLERESVDLHEISSSEVTPTESREKLDETPFEMIDGTDISSGIYPTERERQTLRRIPGKFPCAAYTIALIEMCERFSYSGTVVVFANFIQQPLPPGSHTGAGFSGQSGALGMGQRTSTGLILFNSFWSHSTPLLGALIADQYLGRYKTIQASNAIAIVGHIVLISAALPSVIVHPHSALVAFLLGIILMGLGVGGFKPNISTLIAEQCQERRMRVIIDRNGQSVIIDPAITKSRIFLYFYMLINIGALLGQLSMVYVEKYVGFWLSFLLPTIMYALCPMVFFLCRHRYISAPPTGSVLVRAFKLVRLAIKGRWSWNPMRLRRNVQDPQLWEEVKPSILSSRPLWMTFDDEWVDQVRRGLQACKVFVWFPLYWLAYKQMSSNLTSQAATLDLYGIPNDVMANANPLTLILLTPLVDCFIYPFLRRVGIRITPVKRITAGFIAASLSMGVAAVVQHYIYTIAACTKRATNCSHADNSPSSGIGAWVQIPAYFLIAASEILAVVTGLEYAFSKAPSNMRSLIMAAFIFTSAVSSGIAQTFVPLSEDPLLLWNYGVIGVLTFLGGCGFWLCHRKLDKEEDALNELPESRDG